jgi:ERCC4-type nuclease
MNIIFDIRENALFEYSKNLSNKFNQFNISKKNLELGDIIISHIADTENTNTEYPNKELVLIERKTVPDLLASIKDGRYEEQSFRLINASGIPKHNIIYVIEGGFSFLSPQDKRTVYSALTSLNLFKGFSIYHTATLQETAEWIFYMTDKITTNISKDKYFCSNSIHEQLVNNEYTNTVLTKQTIQPVQPYSSVIVNKIKNQNITPEIIGEIILCQIPGISSVSAKAIIDKFDRSFLSLINAIQSPDSESIFKEIILEKDGKTRKISKVCYENICKFLREKKEKTE